MLTAAPTPNCLALNGARTYFARVHKGCGAPGGGAVQIDGWKAMTDLEARRRRLKLSRVTLARILNVDPATVYRQERGVMSALWDYAMRGVEAEAKLAKPDLQSHQARVDTRDLIADAMVEHGRRYTGGKNETAEAAAQAGQGGCGAGNRPSRTVALTDAIARGRNGSSGPGGGARKIGDRQAMTPRSDR